MAQARPTSLPALRRCLLFALGCPALAFVLELALWEQLEPFVWILFYPAVFAACWWGNLAAGVAATLVSAGLAWFFFLPPRFSVEVMEGPAQLSTLVFCVMGLSFAVVCERLRSAVRNASLALAASRQANGLLDDHVRQRTAELSRSHDSARASEALLRATVDAAMDSMLAIDPAGRVVLMNQSAASVLRCDPSAALGQPIDRFVPPGLRARYARLLGAFARGRRGRSRVRHGLRLSAQRADGDDLSIAASLVQTDTPSTSLTIVMFRDLSEQRRVQTALRLSEERFHTMFDHMLEGCQFLDRDFRYLYINDAALKHARVPRSALLGKRMMDVFPGIEHTDMFKALSRCMTERVPQHLQNFFTYPDGTCGWFDLSIQPSPEGVFVLSEEVTERKAAESALKASDTRFRQLAESLPQLIWTSDATGTCDFVNNRWAEFAGVPRHELLGNGWLARVHPDDRAAFATWMGSTLAEVPRGDVERECRLLRHDGVYRHFEVRAAACLDEHGRVERWVGANTDVEARRIAEARERDTQKMEALGTLAGGIAHDFNNLLMAIKGNAALLGSEHADDPHVTARVAEITKAGARASDLVRRILMFSRQGDTAHVPVEVGPLLSEVADLVRPGLLPDVTLVVRDCTDAPWLSGDATQAYQVLMNLINNAAHAIGERRGRIEVSASLVTLTDAREVAALRPGSYVRIDVRDDGCGMDEATMARIFDPFFTTKPVGKGTGLGLSVVDGIVKNHGGAVVVESLPHQGSRFTLYFPAASPPRASLPAAPPERAEGRGESVLYVDDDPSVLLLAELSLRRLGYDVVGVKDADQALSLFCAEPQRFAAVITDYSMPGMTGVELTRELLAQRTGLPVILTSGYMQPDEQYAAHAAGVRAVYFKPVSLEELGRALRRELAAPM
jgi:PAS domain S-box-containing protein